MANIRDVTPEEEAAWDHWADDRPEVIQNLAKAFKPWKLYLLKSSDHRVVLYSFSEDGTISVVVSGKYNLLSFERKVFGIDPGDLEECDLPGPDEPVGVYLTEAEQLQHINNRRAENGLAPLTPDELAEMAMDGECAMSDTEGAPHSRGDGHGENDG